MASYCESCGSPLEEGALFCVACGAKVEADEGIVEVANEPDPVQIADIPPIAQAPAELAPPLEQLSGSIVVEETPLAEVAIEEVSPQPDTHSPIAASPNEQIDRSSFVSKPSKMPVFAIIGVVVLACLVTGIWLLVGGNGSKKNDSNKPVVATNSSTPPKVTSNSDNGKWKTATDKRHEEVAKLRTKVTIVLSNVSAAGWSDTICNKELPNLTALSKEVDDIGRSDLSAYWQSLSLFIKACNAASNKDRVNAKVYLSQATDKLSTVVNSGTGIDTTLKGDVIGSIGSYKSLANDIGLPPDYVVCKKLNQFKKDLDSE